MSCPNKIKSLNRNNIKIRLGKIEDLQAVIEAPKGSQLGDTYYYDVEKITRIFSNVLSTNQVFVAEYEGEVRGYAWYESHGVFGHFPYVRSLAIHQNFRGLGIGSKLLDHVEQIAFDQGNKIFLLVSYFNDSAKKLYKSRGYKELTKIDSLFIEGVHEHMMMKLK